ncbi:substrate-binding domain-containing protein [Paenibacillus pasadenensis]|uniref:Putative molybdate-responsive regulator YvgK in bacilli n=1 Tax=Paenibacillus pasadenensis TaxID=217090 RepID=A0A2N5N0R8_9BACL|nr:helix-turn-helix transcriptional regulator [Paenibacillus pasadenensis]PLT43915.1 putative molybdate-responsive regulator YvgK in bacilli [Paenibacillus pasadenensis]
MPDESYTTEDIARLLKISKLTVYDLIKKGALSAYRVGKQMRVDASDLEAYKQKAKEREAGASAYGARSDKPGPGAQRDRTGTGVHSDRAGLAYPDRTGLDMHSDRIGQGVYSDRTGPGVHSDRPGLAYPDRTGLGTSLDPTNPAASIGTPRGEIGSFEAARPLAAFEPAHTVVLTGQDPGMDLLAAYLSRAGFRPLRSHKGSLDSLIDLYQGASDVVSTHLWDGDTDTYNLPYIRRLLVGAPLIVVNLLVRPAGLYVAQGNPLGLTGWGDLGRKGLRIVNRERGAGARVLLDEQLRLHGLAADGIAGYDRCVNSHLEIAAAVASGEADAGVGMAKAAELVGGLDFLPLIQERYDLVVLRTKANERLLAELRRVLELPAFRKELGAITGCDVSRTGTVWLEA